MLTTEAFANLKKQIVDYVERNSWIELDGDIENFDGNDLRFTTREHGDVGAEEYSQKDYDEATRIMLEVMKMYNHFILQYEVTDAPTNCLFCLSCFF